MKIIMEEEILLKNFWGNKLFKYYLLLFILFLIYIFFVLNKINNINNYKYLLIN